MPTPLNTDVTGRDDWEVASYSIATITGPQRVGGMVRQHFGIHRADPTCWVLTHLPTGAMLGRSETQSAAVRVVSLIEGLIDWGFSDISGLARQDHRPVHAALLDSGLTIPNDGRPTWSRFASSRVQGHA